MKPPAEILRDLATEIEETAELVSGLTDDAWATPTPAPEWTVADQVAHLTFVFHLARTAASDATAFSRLVEGASGDFDGAVDTSLREFRGFPPAELLARYRALGRGSVEALGAVPADRTVPWLVNPLPPPVLAAAGVMEVFAHGQDIADALGVVREPTDRLYHLVWFASLTSDFGYLARGMTPPPEPLRIEVVGPGGDTWAHGPQDAENTVTGPAHDLCLLVTRRRHRADLALRATGPVADRWLDIAQAYRGSPGAGRRPGQFAGV
ncbi:TIGR03084 family metal-binding protein [Streptomyces spiramenti]|uniref:TIGR03084 family protein n=1 Tax=Streptomyces spiramenti TaxID=2720606 RepID=A0ABX1AY23_9ACTN|nr:TIGR03084 family metal-binding protein [Streptomyces spiramenti]NJP69287.1 TIGR03084 family protein [Streptomyces spiramenti]